MSENPESPDSPESTEPDEPLGDITRRIREKRGGRASGERSEAGAIGGDDAEGDDERDPDTGFDFGSETDGSDAHPGADSDAVDVDDIDLDADVDSDELFEEMDISDIDTDDVWESVLTDDANDDAVTNTSPTADIGPTREVESTVGEDHVVPKDDYCESCHFFSAPPTVECSYEGSEIVEIIDSDQFRVRNCPVAAGTHNVYGEPIDAESNDEPGASPSD